jgi:hypothetical protein
MLFERRMRKVEEIGGKAKEGISKDLGSHTH